MSTDFEVVPANAQPGGDERRQPTVTVSFDTDSGVLSPVAAEDAGGRRAAMTRANRIADSLMANAVQVDEHGATIDTETPVDGEVADVEAPAEDQSGEDAGETGADGEQPVEEEGGEDEKPADVPFDVTELRGQLAEAQRELDELRGNTARANFAAYFDDPAGFVKAKLAEAIGVEPDSPLLLEEWRSLLTELTLDGIGVADLPQEQQAQFRADRFDRQIKLDKHRRQAEQRAQQTSQQEERARNMIQSVVTSTADKFPTLPLAEARYGRPAWVLTRDRLIQGIRSGEIRDWQSKAPADLYTEAIRLLDSETQQWAKQLGPRIAHLASATAPASPGVATAPQPKKADKSQGAPRTSANTAKPRTLPQQRAGAAPARPGVPKQGSPQPLPRDPEARRRALLAKYAK